MKKVFIIAEAGVNHNGSIELAKKLIDAAAEAKADAVKFQTFKTELCVSKNAKKASYQEQTTGKDESQFEMIKKLELNAHAHEELIKYCKFKNIMFLSTPFDSYSIELLDGFGLEIFKIPSGEITNLPYLRQIGRLNKKIILSTGMANLGEVEAAINALTQSGTNHENIALLHANTQYPTPMRDVNLKAMLTMKEAFKLDVGYSDHTLGIEVPIAAAIRMRSSKTTRNPISAIENCLVPLLVSAVRGGEDLSASALVRGLGGPTARTNIHEARMRVRDWIVIAFLAIAAICAVITPLLYY